MTSAPLTSVVLATYNRFELLVRLLDDLSSQTLDAGRFEVIVVDDGSAEPRAAERIGVAAYPFALDRSRASERGPGCCATSGESWLPAARSWCSSTTTCARPSRFLAEHLAHHSGREARWR